jgi:hypothetical protein
MSSAVVPTSDSSCDRRPAVALRSRCCSAAVTICGHGLGHCQPCAIWPAPQHLGKDRGRMQHHDLCYESTYRYAHWRVFDTLVGDRISISTSGWCIRCSPVGGELVMPRSGTRQLSSERSRSDGTSRIGRHVRKPRITFRLAGFERHSALRPAYRFGMLIGTQVEIARTRLAIGSEASSASARRAWGSRWQAAYTLRPINARPATNRRQSARSCRRAPRWPDRLTRAAMHGVVGGSRIVKSDQTAVADQIGVQHGDQLSSPCVRRR